MQDEYIHKKTGNHYHLMTDNFMFKDFNKKKLEILSGAED